jgi:hypothetical protein
VKSWEDNGKKAKGKRQKSKGKRAALFNSDKKPLFLIPLLPFDFCLLPFALSLLTPAV